MKPHFSPSQIDMWFRCSQQWVFRYEDGIIIPPLVAAIIGTGTHHAGEEDLKHKIETGDLLDLEQVKDLARDKVNDVWEDSGARLIPEERARGESVVKGEAVDTTVSLVTLYHTKVAPDILPAHVEREWRLEISGFPYDLIGRIDLQEASGRIRDTKTRSKTPPAGDAAGLSQLTAYSLAMLKIEGALPPLAIDYLVKLKTPKHVLQETTRTEADINRYLRRMEAMARAIEKGVVLPAVQGSWWCGPKWCGYWDRCKWVH